MAIPTRSGQSARLLSGVALALVLVGCADQQPTAPESTQQVRLPGGSAPVSVSSVITITDTNGKSKTFTTVQKLRPVATGGRLMSMMITDSSARASGYTRPLTPILAVSTGRAVGNYTQFVTDSTTRKIYKVVATGPMIYNYPVTDVYAYNSAGQKVAEVHYMWGAVTGGHALLKQKEISYSTSNIVTASVLSTVTSPALYAGAEVQRKSARVSSLLASVGCFFAPKAALAQEIKTRRAKFPGGNMVAQPGSGCGARGTTLALNVGTVGAESATGVLEVLMIPVYLGSWVSLGYALWDYLDCLHQMPRCDGGYCDGTGGGSGF